MPKTFRFEAHSMLRQVGGGVTMPVIQQYGGMEAEASLDYTAKSHLFINK